MKIANERTYEQLDLLKEQFTAHLRKKTPIQQIKPKNPISGRFRWVLPLFLMAGGGYLIYRNTPTLQEYLLQTGRITYQQSVAWSAIQTYLYCKWLQITSRHGLTASLTLANQCYLTRLESDLLFLSERSPEKKLQIETRSNLSIGFLSWGNVEKIRYINPYGDLVERHRTSKLMLGNWIRIWGKTTERLIKREPVFAHYQKEIQQIGTHCESVNWLAQWQLKKEQHEQAIQSCKEESRRVSEKLRKFLEQRMRQEKKVEQNQRSSTNSK